MEHQKQNQNFGKHWGITTRACSRCGGDLSGRYKKQRYCKACHAEYERNRRPKYSEWPEEAKVKLRARIKAQKNKTDKQPCIVCGDEKSERHHEDYSKPLKITWLCRKCHAAYHGNGSDLKSSVSRVINILARIDLLIDDHLKQANSM